MGPIYISSPSYNCQCPTASSIYALYDQTAYLRNVNVLSTEGAVRQGRQATEIQVLYGGRDSDSSYVMAAALLTTQVLLMAENINIFKNRLDKFWSSYDFVYLFRAQPLDTGSVK